MPGCAKHMDTIEPPLFTCDASLDFDSHMSPVYETDDAVSRPFALRRKSQSWT
jgi:hypothetical protein